MIEIDDMFPHLDQDTRNKILKTSMDMAIAHMTSIGTALETLQRAMEPVFIPFSEILKGLQFLSLSRAEMRQVKHQRRQERNLFLTHGKHGLKRPR